ncbi:rhodanese-like domain-containing protein [bacterium]|nr:rhodanese-like domain-containing protein [bacterium]
MQPEALKPNFILLDTRENEEFEVSHLENAIFVGYNNFSLDSLKNFSKTDTFVVYCSVGYRSSKIIEKMKNAGFKNVSNLYGGIFYWSNKGFPVFRNGKKTKKVHPYNKFWAKFLNEKTPD